MSDTRKYRKFTRAAEGSSSCWRRLRGDRSIAEICREHDISETLLRRWREQALEAGAERFAAARASAPKAESSAGKIAELERALGRKTYELEIAGKLLRDWE